MWIILVITVHNVVAARLCFHGRLWFCSQGGGVVDTPSSRQIPQTDTPPRSVHAGIHPPCPVHAGIPPPPGRPLQRIVRILLKCILVFKNFYFQIVGLPTGTVCFCTYMIGIQECIPVGYVPVTAVAVPRGGGLHQALPPQGPGTPPPPPPPRGQNSWHTLLKILPCPKLRLRAVNIAQMYTKFLFSWDSEILVRAHSFTDLVAYLLLHILWTTCKSRLGWKIEYNSSFNCD